MEKIDRTGEVSYNNFGSLMRITNYRSGRDIDVYFEEYDYIKEHTQYSKFKNGKIRCPYEKRVFSIGYLGEGRFDASINRKSTKYYSIWNGMLKRCYDPKFIEKRPTYAGCKVYPEWHNFQTFGEWLDKNYYEIEGQTMNLDKDILYKGNKIYSPDTCVFVPSRINTLFIKCDECRGGLTVGVTYHRKKYDARCRVDGKREYLGCYDTPQQAFQAYKNFKEQYIKEVADQYKNVIPQKLYKAMINYKVEIND